MPRSRRRGDGLVKAYYQRYDEWNRLVKDAYHRLELDTTLHFLGKHLPDRGRLLDIGGGPGRYAIELARRGYSVSLVDLTPGNVEQARRNVRRSGVARQVPQILEGSLTDLSGFEDHSFEGVLCLGGALNHVLAPRDRDRAVKEIVRIAQVGGPVFVSVISRFAQLIDGLALHPDGLRTDPNHHWRILRTGNYDGHRGFAPAHFFAPDELVALLHNHGLEVVESVGLEGLAAGRNQIVNRLARVDPGAWRSWWRFHIATCTDPSVVATSQHFLLVARKRGTSDVQPPA